MATADYSPVTDVARHRWLYLGLLTALAVWCAVDVMTRGAINVRRIHEHRTDFTVYTEAGAAFFDGRDPYQVTNPRGWRYLYPPLFAILVSPLHALPSTGQVCVWFVLSVAMAFGCYYEMRRLIALLNRQTGLRRRPNASAVLDRIGGPADRAAPEFELSATRAGRDPQALSPVARLSHLRICGRGARHWFLAGIVFAMAGILKLTPLLPVACLILYDGVLGLTQRSARLARLRAASLSAGLGSRGWWFSRLLLPAACSRLEGEPAAPGTWFSGVVTKVIDVRTSDFGEDVRTVRNQSLDNAAYRLGNWIDLPICRRPG